MMLYWFISEKKEIQGGIDNKYCQKTKEIASSENNLVHRPRNSKSHFAHGKEKNKNDRAMHMENEN